MCWCTRCARHKFSYHESVLRNTTNITTSTSNVNDVCLNACSNINAVSIRKLALAVPRQEPPRRLPHGPLRGRRPTYIYTYIICICIYNHIYIYIYREREIDREGERERDMYIYIYIYTYSHIHVYTHIIVCM